MKQAMTDGWRVAAALAAMLVVGVLEARSDTFGTVGNEFNIDFVTVGNAGNLNDRPLDDTAPDFSSPYGGVGYEFRMGVYEISQNDITKATASGLSGVSAGAWTGDRPAANVTWYEAALFVNWLNESTGHQAAYRFVGGVMQLWDAADAWTLDGTNLYRHQDAYYFLPSEDEWYKAAYHKNDGVTSNYWDYATGSDGAPTAVFAGTNSGTAVYDFANFQPAPVYTSGGESPYGTMGQNGNVFELLESALDGVNDSTNETRVYRGGWYASGSSHLIPSTRFSWDPANQGTGSGFRVAGVIPEPSHIGMLIGAVAVCVALRLRLRRRI